MVEALDQVLASVDRELVAVVEKKMRKLGMTIYTGTKALGLKETDPAKCFVLHLEIETPSKKKEVLEADCILVSVGRRPNSDGMGLEKIGVKLDARGNIQTNNLGQTNVAGVYAIGDVDGAPQLAHRASMDGLLAASTIAGEKIIKDYKTVPWAVFCDPEIAVCGLSEKEATEKNSLFESANFLSPQTAGRSSTNDTDGFIKVLVSEKDESVIGVHIVGPEASNLIAEAALAVEMGATAEDIIRTIHTHPTLPEAFPEAVEAAFYKSIHMYKPAPAAGQGGRGAGVREMEHGRA